MKQEDVNSPTCLGWSKLTEVRTVHSNELQATVLAGKFGRSTEFHKLARAEQNLQGCAVRDIISVAVTLL